MNLGIKGRKAIVNGGSAGMGRGAALALAREGVELYVSARGAERLLQSCADIRAQTGARVIPIVADHSTDEGRARILAACPEPDILVGTCSPPRATEDYRTVTRSDWLANIDVTLLAPVAFMQAIIPGMAARRWGRVVNIATGAAKYPHELRILSGPPRAALVNYTVAVARSVARDNVTINNILPGMHHTDSVRSNFGARAAAKGTSYEAEVEKFIDHFRIPANKFGDPDDVGAFVALLCSEFANYTTGQSICIDGGVSNSTF